MALKKEQKKDNGVIFFIHDTANVSFDAAAYIFSEVINCSQFQGVCRCESDDFD